MQAMLQMGKLNIKILKQVADAGDKVCKVSKPQ